MIKLAILATQYGIPIPTLLDGLRKVFGIKCMECKAVTTVLRKLNEIGPKQTELIIKGILNR